MQKLSIYLSFFLGIYHANGFIWPIDNKYGKSQYKYTFSELFMYANEEAPLGIPALYKSRISVDLDLDISLENPHDVVVKIAVFRVPLKV